MREKLLELADRLEGHTRSGQHPWWREGREVVQVIVEEIRTVLDAKEPDEERAP